VLNLQWQVKTQVDGLHEKVKRQPEQSSAQEARSAAQSKSQPGQTGHDVVTPSQVTDPRREGQLLSAAEQLVTLLLPLQLTVLPSQQFAVALQRDFGPICGRLAAGTAAGVASEARNA